jgi:hypothetical protein
MQQHPCPPSTSAPPAARPARRVGVEVGGEARADRAALEQERGAGAAKRCTLMPGRTSRRGGGWVDRGGAKKYFKNNYPYEHLGGSQWTSIGQNKGRRTSSASALRCARALHGRQPRPHAPTPSHVIPPASLPHGREVPGTGTGIVQAQPAHLLDDARPPRRRHGMAKTKA